MKNLVLASAVALVALSVPALAQCCDKEKGDKAQATKLAAAQASDKDKANCEAKLASGECDKSKCDEAAKLASGATCDKSAANVALVAGGGCDKAACGEGGCDKASCDKLAKGECTGSGCWSGPKMMYRVAGETLKCPKNADVLAKALDSKVEFVVGDKVFADRNEALLATADLLESHLKTITTVSYAVGDECVGCPTTAKNLAAKSDKPMKFRVATFTFDSKEAAEKAAERARAAAEKVQWTMVVNGKDYACEQSATLAAGDKPCEYKVGDAKTKCKATARVMLAQARIDAARQAIASAAGAGETIATAVGS